jgi:hypothetical protein
MKSHCNPINELFLIVNGCSKLNRDMVVGMINITLAQAWMAKIKPGC